MILDGNFIYAAIKVKLDIKERLEKLLQGETVRLFVLKSVLTELNAVGPKAAEAFKFAKTFCTVIDDDAFAGEETPAERLVACLRKQAKDRSSSSSSSSSKNYFVATQDKDLRARLAAIPGVPIIYMNKVVLVLEPPSSQSKETSLEIEATKESLTPLEAEVLEKVNKRAKGVNIVGGEFAAARSVDDSSTTQERRKRKATGANPLASKKASQVCLPPFIACSLIFVLPSLAHPSLLFIVSPYFSDLGFAFVQKAETEQVQTIRLMTFCFYRILS